MKEKTTLTFEDFQKDIAKYRTHFKFQMKLTFFVFFHFIICFGKTFLCLILIHFFNSFNLKKYMIVIFQYFAQFKELFLMWIIIIIGIWNCSIQFFFSQFAFTLCSPRSKWLFYRDKILEFILFLFRVQCSFSFRNSFKTIVQLFIVVSSVVLLTHWNECYSNHLMTIIIIAFK